MVARRTGNSTAAGRFKARSARHSDSARRREAQAAAVPRAPLQAPSQAPATAGPPRPSFPVSTAGCWRPQFCRRSLPQAPARHDGHCSVRADAATSRPMLICENGTKSFIVSLQRHRRHSRELDGPYRAPPPPGAEVDARAARRCSHASLALRAPASGRSCCCCCVGRWRAARLG